MSAHGEKPKNKTSTGTSMYSEQFQLDRHAQVHHEQVKYIRFMVDSRAPVIKLWRTFLVWYFWLGRSFWVLAKNFEFLAGNQLYELQTHRRRRWVSKKKHCNFRQKTATFEHRHENKTCSACPNDQIWQLDNLTTWQLDTFEHRHENKSCSACLKDQTWQLDNFIKFSKFSSFQ